MRRIKEDEKSAGSRGKGSGRGRGRRDRKTPTFSNRDDTSSGTSCSRNTSTNPTRPSKPREQRKTGHSNHKPVSKFPLWGVVTSTVRSSKSRESSTAAAASNRRVGSTLFWMNESSSSSSDDDSQISGIGKQRQLSRTGTAFVDVENCMYKGVIYCLRDSQLRVGDLIRLELGTKTNHRRRETKIRAWKKVSSSSLAQRFQAKMCHVDLVVLNRLEGILSGKGTQQQLPVDKDSLGLVLGYLPAGDRYECSLVCKEWWILTHRHHTTLRYVFPSRNMITDWIQRNTQTSPSLLSSLQTLAQLPLDLSASPQQQALTNSLRIITKRFPTTTIADSNRQLLLNTLLNRKVHPAESLGKFAPLSAVWEASVVSALFTLRLDTALRLVRGVEEVSLPTEQGVKGAFQVCFQRWLILAWPKQYRKMCAAISTHFAGEEFEGNSVVELERLSLG